MKSTRATPRTNGADKFISKDSGLAFLEDVEAMESVSPGSEGGYVGRAEVSSEIEGATEVEGLSRRLYKLKSSTSELTSVSSVCGSDARFVDVLDGKDVDCRGECAGDDREMER